MKKYLFAYLLIMVPLAAFSQVLTFTYQYHDDLAKAGKIRLETPDKTLDFETSASAGYLVASNNPYYQATKDVGPIPNGTWEVYEIKDEKMAIMRLRPTNDVVTSERDGFLIHGYGAGSTPDKSSKGCIIVHPDYRKKIMAAFKKYGIIKLIVNNISPSGRGTQG